jgi:hypothetical protein
MTVIVSCVNAADQKNADCPIWKRAIVQPPARKTATTCAKILIADVT